MSTIDYRNGGTPALPASLTAPSAAQITFIRTLLAERVLPREERRGNVEARLESGEMSKQDASTFITVLLDCAKKPAVHTDGAALTEGYYLQEDTVYRVVAAKSTGNLYAKRLVTTEFGRAAWDYAPGAMRHLVGAARLTLEQAAEMGTRYGVCVICGATLTDPESVERGIGPVCATRV